jgi:hypothetical protein
LKAMQDDPDRTPKARRPAPRTASAGAFLKTELQRRSSDASVCYPPIKLKSNHPLDENSPSLLNTYGQQISSKIPERRPSKSKAFFLKALGSRNAYEVDSMFDTSKGTLVRRFSRSGRSSTSSSFYPDSMVSAQAEHFADHNGMYFIQRLFAFSQL